MFNLTKERLRLKAGVEVFMDGEASQDSGSVVLNDVSDSHAKGCVTTNAQYNVELRFHGQQLEGSCDCSDSDGFDFCSHCVAVGLEAIRQSRRRQLQQTGNARQRVESFLLTNSKEELARYILERIPSESGEFQRLLLLSHISLNGDFVAAKKLLTKLTRPPAKLFTKNRVEAYFSRLQLFLTTLMDLPLEKSVGACELVKLKKLVKYFLSRVLSLALEADTRHYETLLAVLFEKLTRYHDLGICSTEEIAHQLIEITLQDRENHFDNLLSQWLNLVGHAARDETAGKLASKENNWRAVLKSCCEHHKALYSSTEANDVSIEEKLADLSSQLASPSGSSQPDQ